MTNERDVAVVCIYRDRFRENVKRLLEPGWRGYLWNFDQAGVDLPGTVGRGPGARPQLLNILVSTALEERPYEWVLIADDDIRLPRGVESLMHEVIAGDYDLAQPAHSWRSYSSHMFTNRRPWLRSRRVSFVEIGPLLTVRRSIADKIFPLSADSLMGWGEDIKWSSELSREYRFGIVDSVPVVHAVKPGRSYSDEDAEWTARDAALTAAGHRSVRSMQRTMSRSWVWGNRA